MSRERGSIAIVALWGVALIAVLLAAASAATRSEVFVAGNALGSARARLAAEAGTQLGLARLLRGERDPQTWQDGGTAVRIAIVDEAGKIDINLAPLDLLTGLFTAAGKPHDVAERLACNVLDRRGDMAPPCPQPDTRRTYRFAAIEELAGVPGIDAPLYERVADCVTVATGASAIDPSVAPRMVLLALPGATEGLVDSYLDSRGFWGGQALPALPFLMASPRRDFTIEAVAITADRARYRADLQIRLTETPSRPYQVMGWRNSSRIPPS
ncbi:MAG TPA: hypothetical protein VFW46_08410 [Stellaceae bacterium]|nr:hypothetical protein [Stellaceae bacterium]